MAAAVLTIPVAGDAPRSRSIPCLAFGAAVQAVERLLQADARAAGLPHGDPVYRVGPEDADRELARAVRATAHAAARAEEDRYRDAAATMHAMLVSTDGGALRDGLRGMRHVEMDAYVLVDRTVRLSLIRAAGVMESLYRVWTSDPGVEAADAFVEDDLEDVDARDAWDDLAEMTSG